MATMKEKDEDQEVVITETPPKEEAADTGKPEPKQADAEDAEDEEHDHDHDGEEDPRGNEDVEATEAEREALRERRRQEKAERKQRREEAIRRDKLEKKFLLDQNDKLEREMKEIRQHLRQQDVAGVDARLADAQQRFQMAEQVYAKAVSAGNGEDAVQALRYRDQAAMELAQLGQAKQRASVVPQQQPQGPSVAVITRAKAFAEEHKEWYDPNGANEDSAIMRAIDAAVARDGYDPSTDEYWTELKNRAAKRLPERFAAVKSTTERQVRGGPALTSGKEHAPRSTRQEVYISPERRAAMEAAGLWDDPVLRKKMAKRYAEYDRNNA